MGPTDLSEALKALKPPQDPNLLVGFETCDDAAVYRLSDDLAFISTADFITPPVDDPYWFGQIAAANSLSDVYAMGGKPLTALNLIMFPMKKLGATLLREILRGGSDKVLEAGASIAGGHSVDDNEPKYGLAVTGVVHPERILTNCGAKDGDALILTKPLGTGVLFNACRSKKLPFRELEFILPQIASLNKNALEIALNFDIHACTDITGFGIVGHALEMAKGSGVGINLFYDKLPFYPNALHMYRKGETTGSNIANRKLAEGLFEKSKNLSREEEELLFDPQTSGGLLLALPSTHADQLTMELRKAGMETAVQVGEAMTTDRPSVRIV
ncbi:MAG: selenide, water dikinase SelD [Thermodesulfobacteriota bacterium]|nr:selenide, water dikinase SelD [Thermodesulfobacteriota bacterium]